MTKNTVISGRPDHTSCEMQSLQESPESAPMNIPGRNESTNNEWSVSDTSDSDFTAEEIHELVSLTLMEVRNLSEQFQNHVRQTMTRDNALAILDFLMRLRAEQDQLTGWLNFQSAATIVFFVTLCTGIMVHSFL